MSSSNTISTLPNAMQPLEPRFGILGMPTELRLMVLQNALTLNTPVIYKCPHYHDWTLPQNNWLAHCTHMDDGWCDHDRMRLSLGPLRGKENVFWLPILTNKLIHAESAGMMARYNTILFESQEGLQCLTDSQRGKQQLASAPSAISSPRQEMRQVEILCDFTWMDTLPDQLEIMDNISSLTLTATQPWLTPRMLQDFLILIGRLPSLKHCKIAMKRESLCVCSWCHLQDGCDIWRGMFEAVSRTVDMINAAMAEALSRRAYRRRRQIGVVGGRDVVEVL